MSTDTIENIEAKADAMIEALTDVLNAQVAFITAAPFEMDTKRTQRNTAFARAADAGCTIRQIAAKAVMSPGTVQRIVKRSRAA